MAHVEAPLGTPLVHTHPENSALVAIAAAAAVEVLAVELAVKLAEGVVVRNKSVRSAFAREVAAGTAEAAGTVVALVVVVAVELEPADIVGIAAVLAVDGRPLDLVLALGPVGLRSRSWQRDQ